MGGLDAVVLTGGIGENGASMRHRILQRFDWLGLVLDEDRNATASVTSAAPVAPVGTENSRVAALVVRTDEALLLALEELDLVWAAPVGEEVRVEHLLFGHCGLHADRVSLH